MKISYTTVKPTVQTNQESEFGSPVTTPILPKLMTRAEMADELDICTKTMNKLLKQSGVQLPKGLILPPNQALIRQVILGIPINSD